MECLLVSLYVLVDEWWQGTHPPVPRKAGRPPTLSESEVLTLAILAQWPRFRSERDFWRFADSTISGRIPRGARTTRGVSDRAAVLPDAAAYTRLRRDGEFRFSGTSNWAP